MDPFMSTFRRSAISVHVADAQATINRIPCADLAAAARHEVGTCAEITWGSEWREENGASAGICFS